MRLTKSDKEILKEYGYTDSDFLQIQRALSKRNTKYEKYDNSRHTSVCDDQPITREEAIELLGREVFLSGVARSCFHWSADRQVNENVHVHFDSSNLHKQ